VNFFETIFLDFDKIDKIPVDYFTSNSNLLLSIIAASFNISSQKSVSSASCTNT